MQLTKESLRALRKCNDVSFHFNSRGGDYSGICASFRDKLGSTASEMRIDCEQSFAFYGKRPDGASDYYSAKPRSAFAMVHSAAHCSRWRTITAMLKAGDDISLTWVADNNNGYLNDATYQGNCSDDAGTHKLHHDYLAIVVKRGKRRFEFFVIDSICTNNTARMVRF